jgi:hypothetical protein
MDMDGLGGAQFRELAPLAGETGAQLFAGTLTARCGHALVSGCQYEASVEEAK